MSMVLMAGRNTAILNALKRKLREIDVDAQVADNVGSAIRELSQHVFDVVLAEVTAAFEGHLIVEDVRKNAPDTRLMVLDDGTRTIRSDLGIESPDRFRQPFDPGEIARSIQKVIEGTARLHEVAYLRHEAGGIFNVDQIIGQSPAMGELAEMVRRVASSKSTVLIEGETGTGKELIAGAIHYSSPRKNRALVKVNCAALHENLLQSELFGHEKGSFTGAIRQRIGRFEQADGGTIFLDEVGDMSLDIQAKMLRILQEQTFERLGGSKTIRVDVRTLAATNRNLWDAVRAGKFREDLLYRLNVIRIITPPLRDRKDDIPLLTEYFLRKYSGELGKSVRGVEPKAMQSLMAYHWPGNVRELENALERAVLLCDGKKISQKDLSLHHAVPDEGGPKMDWLELPPEGTSLKEVEKRLILQALQRSNWVQKEAAKLLGISRRSLHYKVGIYHISHPSWRRNR